MFRTTTWMVLFVASQMIPSPLIAAAAPRVIPLYPGAAPRGIGRRHRKDTGAQLAKRRLINRTSGTIFTARRARDRCARVLHPD